MQTLSRKHPAFALLCGALVAATTLVAAASPRIQTGPTAEVTQDGLHRVDGGTFDRAWVKPGTDLNGYTKVMLTITDMQFREVKDPGMRRSASEFPLDDAQKQGLQKTIYEAFVAELGKSKRFALTDQRGPGVLEIRGGIVDVVSHVPEEPIGRGVTLLKSLGEATLVVELLDSQTGKVLARAIDRRAAEAIHPIRANSVTTKSEVKFAAQRWASLLRRRLDDFAVL
jgi:hypothetical protein